MEINFDISASILNRRLHIYYPRYERSSVKSKLLISVYDIWIVPGNSSVSKECRANGRSIRGSTLSNSYQDKGTRG